MTTTEQTTAERMLSIIGTNFTIVHDQRDIRVADHGKAAEIIAAEIDGLRAELRTANAEIARLMPLPEIYTLWKKIIEDGNPSRDTVAHFIELAHEAAERAAHAPADLRTPTDQRIAALEAQLAERDAQIAALTPDAEAHRAVKRLYPIFEEYRSQGNPQEMAAYIERLKIKAEAWDARDAWGLNTYTPANDELYAKYIAAAARAREAAK